MGRWQWSQETSGKHRAGTKQSAHLPCRTPWTSFAGIPANATQRLRTRSTRFSYRVGPQQLAQPLRDEALQHVSKGSLHRILPRFPVDTITSSHRTKWTPCVWSVWIITIQTIATLIAMELECGMSLGIFPASQCQQCHPSSSQWRSDSHDNSLSGHLLEEIGPLQSSSDFRFRSQTWWLTTILAIQITRHGEQSLRLRLRWQGSDLQREWQWCWAVSASVEAPQGRNQRRQVAPDQWAAQWMISAQSGHCTAREAYVSFESLLADNEGTETETIARRSHNDAARIWRWLEQGSEPI